MEFKFQSIHQRSSTYYAAPPNLPPPTDHPYSIHPAIRAGMTNYALGHSGFLQSPNFNSNPNPWPADFQEAMQYQRELEKERIRAEIIAEEIVRRRILEEEVRRELMMEREMALKCGYAEPLSMRFGPRVPPLLTNVEHREKFGGPEVGFRSFETAHREIGFRGDFETLPFQRDPIVATASGSGNGIRNGTPAKPIVRQEIKGATGTPSKPIVDLQEIRGVTSSELAKDKVIILAKSTVTAAADLKRKAVTQPDGPTAELLSGGSKKQKTKDDWSCALCRVCATNERGLNEHLQGRKHKAKERALLTKKKGFGTTPLPKKSIVAKSKQVKTPALQTASTSENKDGKAQGGVGNNADQKNENSGEKMENGEEAVPEGTPGAAKRNRKYKKKPASETPLTFKNKDEKACGTGDNLAQKNEHSGEKENEGAAKGPPVAAKLKKDYRFWCEACKVGANNEKVMNGHKKGKKHLAWLSRSNQTGEKKISTPGITTMENVCTEETQQETVGEQVEDKDTNVDNNQTTTDDKGKKMSETLSTDITVDGNNQVVAGAEDDL